MHIIYYFVEKSRTDLSLSNGWISYSKAPAVLNSTIYLYSVGTTAYFFCDDGFTLSHQDSRTCQASGNWNKQTPTCDQSN